MISSIIESLLRPVRRAAFVAGLSTALYALMGVFALVGIGFLTATGFLALLESFSALEASFIVSLVFFGLCLLLFIVLKVWTSSRKQEDFKREVMAKRAKTVSNLISARRPSPVAAFLATRAWGRRFKSARPFKFKPLPFLVGATIVGLITGRRI